MIRALAILCVIAGVAHAQAPATTQPAAEVLAKANAAATSGEWAHVSELVEPLLSGQLAQADLAEAHRLAGLAAFFAQHQPEAETHFLAYLKLDPDAHLDPALVPPEAVTFFEDVKARHLSEVNAARPRVRKRVWALNLVPPLGQFQNGDRTKGIILGSALVAFAATNITTFFVLRSWCKTTSGPSGTGASCDATVDHTHASSSLRALNIASGVGFFALYAYGVYDGVVGYRRRTREQYLAPYAAPNNGGVIIGALGSF